MYDDYDSRDGYDDRAPPRRPPPPPRDRGLDRGPEPRGPPPERKPKRVSYKSIAGMIVAIVALIFVFILMYSGYSWYLLTYEEQPENTPMEKYTYNFEYERTDFSVESKFANFSMKETVSYNNGTIKEQSKEVKGVMDWVGNLYLISIILLIVSIILMPIGAMGKMPHGIALIPLLLALIFTLIIPIYFFIYFPSGLETQSEFFEQWISGGSNDTGFQYDGDFFGSKSGDFFSEETQLQMEFKMEFAPQMAFWLSFVPMFIILAALAVYSSGKKDLMYGGPPRRPPPPGRGPPGEYDDDYYERPPPGRRPPPDDYDYGGPPRRPPPARPPRGRAPPPRQGYDNYDGGSGYDEHYEPPVLQKDYNFDSARGRQPPTRRTY